MLLELVMLALHLLLIALISIRILIIQHMLTEQERSNSFVLPLLFSLADD